jgi:hypothetical protein
MKLICSRNGLKLNVSHCLVFVVLRIVEAIFWRMCRVLCTYVLIVGLGL